MSKINNLRKINNSTIINKSAENPATTHIRDRKTNMQKIKIKENKNRIHLIFADTVSNPPVLHYQIPKTRKVPAW